METFQISSKWQNAKKFFHGNANSEWKITIFNFKIFFEIETIWAKKKQGKIEEREKRGKEEEKRKKRREERRGNQEAGYDNVMKG